MKEKLNHPTTTQLIAAVIGFAIGITACMFTHHISPVASQLLGACHCQHCETK